MYSILQNKITIESSKNIENSKLHLQNTIKEETEKFFNKFEISTWLNAGFLIEQKLLDFKKNIEVQTSKNILLTSRWDWIQARLIPDILEEISDEKKYILWWFEEPENSYEYKNSKKLADEFYNKFSNNKQIFITTHSKEFLWIVDKNNTSKISIYRIFKSSKDNSKIEKYMEGRWFEKNEILFEFLDWNDKRILDTSDSNDTLQKIYDDLWIIDESRIINELQNRIHQLNLSYEELVKLKEKLDDSVNKLENLKHENIKLQNLLSQAKEENVVIIFCENQNSTIYNNLNLPNIKFIWSDSKIYAFDTAKSNNNKNVFALIDKDYLTDHEVDFIESKTNVRILNFYCIENYLYHPQNMLEHFKSIWKQNFDIIKYTEEIIEEFKNRFDITKIWSWRSSYKKIIEFCKTVYDPDTLNNIINEKDFTNIYKFFSMKDNCKWLEYRRNISLTDLSKTKRFKSMIIKHINSMGI